jgi:hypothetical protein
VVWYIRIKKEVATMKDLKEQKQETKVSVEREIDRYYEEFEKASADLTCDIGGFEKIIMEHKRRLDEILRDAAGKALSVVDVEEKNAPSANDRRGL